MNTTIRHPYHSWLYFSTYEDNVFILNFDQRILDDNNNFIRYIEPFEIDRICQRTIQFLQLKRLEWGFQNNECKIWCDKEDLPSFYDIINKLVREDLKLFLNDGTNIEVTRKDYPMNIEKEERLFLTYLLNEEQNNYQTPFLTQLAIHRTNFWTTSAGKEFAIHLQRKYLLPNEIDKDYPTTSEIYGEENKNLFV